MKLLGQFDTSGNYQAYAEEREVFRFGNSLRDEDGFLEAVLDEYGDWVSPTMKRLGLKSIIKVEP